MITVHSREGFLYELRSCLPDKPVGAELGVLYGDLSQMILDIINPSLLVLVDPYREGDIKYSGYLSSVSVEYSTEDDYQDLIRKFSNEIFTGQVEVKRKTSFEAVIYETDGTFDFCYHDGSHLYDDLKRDLNQWLSKVKRQGIVCGHDLIDFDGFGVKQAVTEFMEEHGFELIIYNENGGDWALKRKQ